MSATPPPPPPPSTPPPPPRSPSGPGAIPPPPPFTPSPPGSPGTPYGPSGPVPARPTSGLATAALVCGVVGLFLFILFVLPVVALVLGLVAASRAKHAPGPGSGLGRARAGWILGLIGVVAFAGFVVAAAFEDGDDDGTISVGRLEEGDCVDVGDDSDSDDVIEELPSRDCDEPHDAEVYLVADLTLDGDEYPGEDRVIADAQQLCAGDAFEDYVGVSFGRSIYDATPLYPIERGWDFGDRSVVCMVVSATGASLTESVKGSGE